jgi:phage baseplate assembly protein W
MADLSLAFGGDLEIDPNGDVLVVDGAALGQERVLRRLLTNQGAYIWQLTYGAGLGKFVGTPGVPDILTAIVQAQMKYEAAVAVSPAPRISAAAGDNGVVVMSVSYTDATSQQLSTLSITV